MSKIRRRRTPAQSAGRRVKNFSEVVLGLSKAQAMQEAGRCPQCSNAECLKACPLGIDIPGFIRIIREGDFLKALQAIRENNSLAGICGRVCSAPCETACILNREENPQPISIRDLERSAFDHGNLKLQEFFNAERANKSNKKVAIIGCGATGLMAGANLLEDGHSVTIFEALHQDGGFLHYAVPEFRLPRKVLDDDVEYIRSLGVEIKTNSIGGQTITIDQLFKKGYDAVLITTGIHWRKGFEFPGRDAKDVLTSQEFLFRMNFMFAYLHPRYMTTPHVGKKIVIIGSGFDAVDCGRLALRLGKKVTLVHPSTEDDLEVSSDDKVYAQEEGLCFEMLTKPLEILKDGQEKVKGLRCVRLDFADKDGQWKLVPVEGSEFIIGADTVIISGQYTANNFISNLTQGLTLNKQGCLCLRKDQSATSLPGVFAAGGAAKGPIPLVDALADGKKAANEIDLYLQGNEKGKA